MARTRTRSEEKRQQIMEAASCLFVEQSFDTVSMDQVARMAGVSKQTVYSHFGSKEELFQAAISAKCTSYQMTEELFEGEDINTVLQQFAQQFSRLILSNEALSVFRTCISQCQTHPKLAQLFYEAGPERVISLFTEYLRQQDQQGTLSIPQPRFAAIQFLKMVQGEQRMRMEMNLGDLLSEEEHQAYLASSVEMFIRAYRVGG